MKTLQDCIPNQLREIITSHDFGDNGGILLSSFLLDGDDEKIQFTVDTGNADIPNQIWQIAITSVKEEKISITWSNQLSLHDDHYLLWQYTYPTASLYFNGEAGNGEKLLSDLYKLHKSEFGYIAPIEKYLNTATDLITLCTFGDGLFAKGPKKLLTFYYECLEKNLKKPYFLEGQNPDAPEDVKLLLLGSSYFIAKDFNFIQLE